MAGWRRWRTMPSPRTSHLAIDRKKASPKAMATVWKGGRARVPVASSASEAQSRMATEPTAVAREVEAGAGAEAMAGPSLYRQKRRVPYVYDCRHFTRGVHHVSSCQNGSAAGAPGLLRHRLRRSAPGAV